MNKTLRELAQAATPGPWKVYDKGRSTPHVGTISPDSKAGWKYDTICDLYEDEADNYDTNNEYVPFSDSVANAEFIAACSPDVVLGLLDEIKDLRTGIAVIKDGWYFTQAANQKLRNALNEIGCTSTEDRIVEIAMNALGD